MDILGRDEKVKRGHRDGARADQDLHAGLLGVAAAQPVDEVGSASSEREAGLQPQSHPIGPGQAEGQRHVQVLLQRGQAQQGRQDLHVS